MDADYTQMAVGLRWAEGCKYLLQHDFRHKFQEEYDFSNVLRFDIHKTNKN